MSQADLPGTDDAPDPPASTEASGFFMQAGNGTPSSLPGTALAQGPPAAAASATQPRPLAARQAAWLFFLLVPVMSFLLPGRYSLAEFGDPGKLLLAYASLGGGALLLRELAARRGLNAWGKLLLGLALGVFVEGIVTRGLYAPLWQGFGTLTNYGRVAGINWLWGMCMLAFHATQSFLLPLLAVELLWPQQHNQPALGRKSTIWLGIGLGLSLLFGYPLLLAGNVDQNSVLKLNLLAHLLFLGICGLLISWALRCRVRPAPAATTAELLPVYQAVVSKGKLRLRPARRQGGGARGLGWLAGLALPFSVFIFPALFKDLLKQPASVAIIVSLALFGGALLYARSRSGKLGPQQQFALLAGTQGAWIVFGLLAPFDNGLLPDDSGALPFVALLGLTALLLLGRSLKLRAGPQGAVATPGLVEQLAPTKPELIVNPAN